MKKLLLACLACLIVAITQPAQAREWPYNERADARAELTQALADAKAAHLPVLLIFGANWCEDCRALDAALKQDRNAALMAKEFKLVKVNVGNFDHNLDIVNRYGNPIRQGIPAAVILSADGQVIYATLAGELASARRMNDEGVEGFFRQALQQAQANKP